MAALEETLRAVGAGEVDSVVVEGRRGPQVFTLEGAGDAYRVLIESMNEGALTLTADGVILYANRRFAGMVAMPLEKVIGTSFLRLLAPADRAGLRLLLKRASRSGSKIQATLRTGDGSTVPAQVSVFPLPGKGRDRATIGVVVTDMTGARRGEERLRALTRRVVQVQEAERGRVALELHDHVTQRLCAVLLHSQALADGLPGRNGPAKREAARLREVLGRTAEAVERISRNLRPGVLDQFGLVAVIRGAGAEFTEETGVPVRFACAEPAVRLPPDAELALYRVLQESLRNVEQHARARHVTLGLTQSRSFVQLSISDDGIGFEPDGRPAGRKRRRGLGLLGMGERAAYVGGALTLRSSPGEGTTVRARVPVGAAGRGGTRGRAS